MTPTMPLRDAAESRSARLVNPSRAGALTSQLASTSHSAWPDPDHVAAQAHHRLIADEDEAGDQAGGGRDGQQGEREGHGRKDLSGKQLAAALRAGRLVFQVPYAVLGGEDVARQHAAQDGQPEITSEAQHHQREGVAGAVNAGAEQRVPGNAALAAEDSGERERAEQQTSASTRVEGCARSFRRSAREAPERPPGGASAGRAGRSRFPPAGGRRGEREEGRLERVHGPGQVARRCPRARGPARARPGPAPRP